MNFALLALFLGLSFLLSGLEAAVLAASLVRARHRADGDARGAAIDSMLGHRERLIAAVSLANGGAGVAAFVIVTLTLVQFFGEAGYAWAFAVWLPVYLIGFELVPKALFRRFPYRMLQRFTPLLRTVDRLFGGLLKIAAPLRFWLLKRTDLQAVDVQREEFRSLAEVAGRHGALTGSEAELIHAVLDFQNLTVADVMISLEETIAIPHSMPAGEWLELAGCEELDQIPTRGADGEINGRIDVLEVLKQGRPPTHAPAADFARLIPDIPANWRAVEALAKLRMQRLPVARVVSAQRRTLGIVTADDILHRLFLGAPAAI